MENSHEFIEARLLVNLGQLLMQMMGFTSTTQIPLEAQLGNELRSLIDLLLDAESEFIRHLGISFHIIHLDNPNIKRVTFEMLSYHPYIDDKY